MDYICDKCGKKVDEGDKYIRCRFCGSRIITKKRQNMAREVSTD